MAKAGRQEESLQGTVLDLWEEAPVRSQGYPAFLVREEGGWRGVSWEEVRGRVDELAAGFLALGVEKGERVAILARTRIEWSLCDYALASIGAIVVPIYPTSTPGECRYLLADSGASGLVVENEKELGTIRAGAALPALRHVAVIEGDGVGTMPLGELARRGREHLEREPEAVSRARASIRASDVFTYIYTSGTTGDPKGCVLTHGNWFAMIESVRRMENLLFPGDVALLFLPLAHNFARLIELAGAGCGLTIAFCPDIVRVARAIEEVRPTVLPSVPRLYETVYARVRGKLEEAEGAKRQIVKRALAAGRRAAERRQRGEPIGPVLAAQLRIADRLVFGKIRERMGGRLRLAISGGAPLSREIIEFFAACGLVVLEGYGLTEATSACTFNQPGRYRFGTVGIPLPGVELALADDGEIMVRGDTVFRGYHGKDAETGEVLTEDGWLLTGDVGTLDADGFLTITDRKKEIIVTAGGKNVSPQKIENALKASGYVSHAVAVGDGRPYISALLSPDDEKVSAVAETEEEVRALMERVVEEVNGRLGPVERIRRFAVLPRALSPEEGEITPTLKLKRRVVEEHFRGEIERLYRGRDGRA